MDASDIARHERTHKAARKASEQSKARQTAQDTLRRILPPGATVYTILRHVSRSGMRRRLDVYALDGSFMRYLSGLVSHATGLRFSAKGGAREDCGIVIDGCGFSASGEIREAIERAIGIPVSSLNVQEL